MLPLLLAAILGLSAASADAQKLARRTGAPASSADEAFLQARQFAAQNDPQRFEAAAARVGAHPLRAYLDYWRLRMRLGGLRVESVNGAAPVASNGAANGNPHGSPSASPNADSNGITNGHRGAVPGPSFAAAAAGAPPASGEPATAGANAAVAPRANGALETQLREFIERQQSTVLADLLRRDWLLVLGRRGDWAGVDVLYPQWVLRDDPQVHCYAWLGRVQRGQPLPREARDALFQPRELGEACGSLVETLARNGTFKRADVWQRLELALEANAIGSVRRLAPLAGMTPGALEAALQRPHKVLGSDTDHDVAVIALVQIARLDPEAAAARQDALGGLPAGERAFVWSQIAAQGMRKLAPAALDWTRQALSARASDDTWVWLARAALRGGDWKTLHAVIEKMGPEGRRDPTWIYWHARAHQALGRPKEAEAQMRLIAGQFHFYGQLASEELGQLTAPPARAVPPTEAELAEPARNEGFARALKFYDLGLRVDGNREWNYQLRGMSDRQLLAAAEWSCQRGMLDRCVNTADRTLAEHDFALRFITPFRDQLAPVAQERGLELAWVYGLIRQESRFIMDARSTAGAQGLMQIIPPTARWIAGRLGVKDFRVEHLHDTPTNLRFGTFYLKSVLDDLDGSPLLASAAYNAGPNRPRSWRSMLPAAVEGAIFAEIIPFTETRDYVKKVLSNATFYSALLTGQPQSLKSRLGSVGPKTSRPSELP